jgi:cytochrome c-type biogenesis protein CcmH/NrfG
MERAVVLDPLSATINNALGNAREMVGRFDDALVAYKQAIEIDPANPNPYGSIADVHAGGLGRYDTAVAWYEKAAALDPGNPDLPASLAYAR